MRHIPVITGIRVLLPMWSFVTLLFRARGMPCRAIRLARMEVWYLFLFRHGHGHIAIIRTKGTDLLGIHEKWCKYQTHGHQQCKRPTENT